MVEFPASYVYFAGVYLRCFFFLAGFLGGCQPLTNLWPLRTSWELQGYFVLILTQFFLFFSSIYKAQLFVLEGVDFLIFEYFPGSFLGAPEDMQIMSGFHPSSVSTGVSVSGRAAGSNEQQRWNLDLQGPGPLQNHHHIAYIATQVHHSRQIANHQVKYHMSNQERCPNYHPTTGHHSTLFY